MELSHITYTGPAFEAHSPVAKLLPPDLRGLLEQINGFVQFGGGLHVRGVCSEPVWHSLGEVMLGETALHRLYPSVAPSDVPFAQDCLADQFFLREGTVYKLQSETGETVSLEVDLWQFFEAVEADPIAYLAMQPLLQFHQEGSALQPGQVLHAYPPFCTKESAAGVSLKGVSTGEALLFLADLASQLSGLKEGETVKFRVVP